MATTTITGSMTQSQLDSVVRFSQEADIVIDTSEVKIVDTQQTPTTDFFSQVVGVKSSSSTGYSYSPLMAEIDKNGKVIGNIIRIEDEFFGLKYMSLKNGANFGKPKIYVEEYADSDVLRTYIPENPRTSPIEYELTLIFIGADRLPGYYDFNEYIRRGYHRYYCVARGISFDFIINDAIEITDEMWKGSVPYLQVKYKLQGIKGYAKY